MALVKMSAAVVVLLAAVIALAFQPDRLPLALAMLLVLAILSGNLPLALVMVLLLGSVLAGRVRD
jgi:hypothetical protein